MHQKSITVPQMHSMAILVSAQMHLKFVNLHEYQKEKKFCESIDLQLQPASVSVWTYADNHSESCISITSICLIHSFNWKRNGMLVVNNSNMHWIRHDWNNGDECEQQQQQYQQKNILQSMPLSRRKRRNVQHVHESYWYWPAFNQFNFKHYVFA